ncbi:AMP-binding protein [Chitinolyticbacter meiyuanensis]|uniref:AMP-binding protein n=1 Tax=Chitinolyticbacter meiyuanensis TaxID=682798 RepID=UPI0011E5A832|nr:AMP-binding protein [Chitinolyticbacter meiyuanensis]
MHHTAPNTLPEQLLVQTRQRSGEIALRHKRLGIWQARRWRELADETARLAAALATAGFGAGDALVLLTQPRPEALLLSLAAQWLGGVAVPLAPDLPDAELHAVLQQLSPHYLFAEDETQWQRVNHGAYRLAIYGDARGLNGIAGWTAYAELHGDAAPAEPQARSAQPAFAFYRVQPGGNIERQAISHAELLQEGVRLVTAEGLTEHEEALAARAFAAGGQARYLLAPWLLAGFRLNFPESTATRDQDRRELGPTLVAGTRETWGRLADQVQQRLPLPGSLRRWLVDAALTPPRSWHGRLWHGIAGHWLVRRPLRDVLGLTRTRVPLLVGDPLTEPAARLLTQLGVVVRGWPDPAQWHGTTGPAVHITGWQAPDYGAALPQPG